MKTKSDNQYILNVSKKIKAIKMLGGKCSKCGESFFLKIDFHHKGNDKEYTFNNIKNRRWSVIEEELKKCFLLCVNCHKEHHSKKSIYDKRVYNKRIFLTFKDVFACERCGYSKCYNALEFHHIDRNDKSFTISSLNLSKIKTVRDLEDSMMEELNKCIVLCASCHRIEHFDKEKYEKYKDEILEKVENYKECPEPIDKELVYGLIDQGYRQIDIAKELNCGKSTICGIVKARRK